MNSPENPASKATRRKVLTLSGLGAVAGVATYLGWARISVAPHVASSTTKTPVAAAKPMPIEEALPAETAGAEAARLFEREAFVPHVNSEFTIIHEGDDSASCRLIEVGAASRMSSSKQTFSSFTLLFEAQPSFLRAGGFCKVQHAKMGEMQFFLSPVGKPGQKALLEAVFSLAI